MPRIVLSTTVQAHTFDVAREFQRRRMLVALFSGYPQARLEKRGIEKADIRARPLPVLAGMGLDRLVRSEAFSLRNEAWPKLAFDRGVSRNLPKGDVFVATSSMGLRSGRAAKRKGMLWICDRPCSHIETQDRILYEAYDREGLRWPGINRRVKETELWEYEEADAILIASEFARRSFLEHGVPESKLWLIPYGVGLERFRPQGSPEPGSFNVLFVGQKTVRKGIPVLLQAFAALEGDEKHLTLIGAGNSAMDALIAKANARQVESLPSMPQDQLADHMSRASVLVLPSVEDGFGMVVAQALACGCPVIVSDQAGASDVVQEGVNGYVFSSGNVEALTAALARIANYPNPQMLRANALASAARLGGWDAYVDTLLGKIESVR
jgi:glycosyltransferase involved in cell wall biosynthesis